MKGLGLIALIVLLLGSVGIWVWHFTTVQTSLPNGALTQALAIAQNNSECTQKGTLTGGGMYNPTSDTWWLTFSPNAAYTQIGCNPACVVSIPSSTAAINWRCTGVIPPATKDDLIEVDIPIANSLIKNPLTISGKARGSWYFEAQFPVKLFDAHGSLLGSAPARAIGDWMTNDYVPFSVILPFATSTTATGTLVLEKDNPSGMPQQANTLEIPVRFSHE